METSILAKYKFKADGKKEIHHKLIKSALNDLESACATEIGYKAGLTQHQVSRRLKELEELNTIFVVKKEKTVFHKTKVNIYSLKNGK